MFQRVDNFDDIPRTSQPTSDDPIVSFRLLRASRNTALREQIVDAHLGFLRGVASRFAGRGESLDDLIQEGAIGLLQAVDRFDPERGVQFHTYAHHCIMSQIQHYLRDRASMIHQPRWVQEIHTKLQRVMAELSQTHGREPSLDEIAEMAQLPAAQVRKILACQPLKYLDSLHAPQPGREGTQDLAETRELTPVHQEPAEMPIEDRIVIQEAISQLKPREQQVVQMFFFEDLTLTEIARKLQISVNYSSYLLKRGIGHIKDLLAEQQPKQQSPAARARKEPRSSDMAPAHGNPDSASTAIHGKITEEITRCQRYPSQFVVMLLQLDCLPEQSEELAAVISAVEHLLRANTRVVDLIAHEADGRFLIMLPHTGREARVLGERACQAIADRKWQPGDISLATRVGFAVYPHDGETMGALYQGAERRLAAADVISANHQTMRGSTARCESRRFGGTVGPPKRRILDLVGNC
ncbi:MAG: sigma-70 family RNA polymerase sigma factor [Armatimonadota bacterium]